MRRVFKLAFFILLATLFFNIVGCVEAGQDISISNRESELPFGENEVIKYKVKLRGITVGKASLTYKGVTELDGKKVHLIIFYTDTVNFKDEEKMYAGLDDFLPIRIERNVNNWGKKEHIIEEYDQQNHSVKITWVGKKGNKTKVIQQDDKIQNVILSTFLHRKLGDLEIDKVFPVTLPLRKVEMRVTRKEKIRTYCGVYDTYRLESFPGRHKIWFESSSLAIPVRISGPFLLGSVNMIMIDYEGGEHASK
ncbi:MAG TPA: DUF3108 domain-containing protein [Candidatus Omnitrophica bacterium]|nr:DUF3108 domain-containing protein [Candidatus Omnitrophota bacterium]